MKLIIILSLTIIGFFNNTKAQNKKKQIESLNTLNETLISNNKLQRLKDSTTISS